MTQLVASLCPYALQKKVDYNNNRPGTVFMFVDKSGNVVEAKEYDEREYNRKEAKTPNNPAMRKTVNPASKSYTTSVQQRALQIVNDAAKRNNPQAGGGLQNVSGQKMSPPFVSGKFRIASGNCGCLKANEQPQKASSLRKRSVSYICPEPSAIGRIKSKGRTSHKDNADEKALVKAKPKRSKTKPSLHRKPSAKYAAESLTSSTDNNNNDGVWFECNVPFRVKIPFPLCTQKLFGMMPLPAGINMNGSSTLPKGKAIAEAKPVARGGGPPSYASMCITMIPAGNSNATPGESTSPPVDLPADPKEKAAGKPKKTTEKKLKGVKKCAVCETCTQTANGMDAKALANPLLSCLEQIEKHLSAENENALKRPGTQSPKCEGRCFAEKSTSVGSVEGTAKDRAAPSAAAAPKNGKTKTPLMTRKMKPPNGVNQRSPRNSQDKSKSKDKPIEPQSAYTGKADPTNVTGLRGRMEPAMCFNRYPPCPRAMMYRRMQACNAPQNMPSRMLPPPPPPSGKLQASEPKKSVSDIITSDIRSSQNYALSSVSQMGKKSHTTSESSQDEAASNPPEQAPGLEKENSLLSSLPKTTSDDSRNSDRSRCCTVCRPEGGVSDTQWNDKHSGRSVRNQDRFYNDRRQESNSKLQQTEERHQFDHFSLPGRARNRDEYPHQRMMGVKMNSCQAKENRTKQRSQSAPSTITYRYEGQHNGEPAMARLQSKKINVGRQVSGSGEEDIYATTMAANMEIINHEMGCQQQQPLVLVPFRVENKNSGQTLAICKGREWRKLTLTKITKVTPQQFRIVSGYCNRAPTGSSGGVPRASPRFARAAPRRASSPAAMPGRQCRPMQGHAAPRAYPSSCLRCPRHTNGPLSNRNARNPVACNRCARTAAMKPTARNVWCCQAVGCRNHSTSVNSFAANGSRPDNRGCLQAAGRSNISGPTAAAPDCSSQRGVNASIDSISISRTYSAGPSSRSRTPSGSEQTLTDQSQFSRNKRSIETVTLMQPRPLRSNESLQNDSYDEPEGTAMEEPQPQDSAMENQFPTGFEPPPAPCHFQCLQYATVPPLRNQNSSMGDFASSQQEFQIGVGYQSQPQSQQQQHSHSYVYSQQSCVGSVCSNATGLIDPRDFLPTVSASLRPNQMPMGVYQSYQPEQTYQRVPCQQPTDMYGSQNHFYGPEDLKESIRIMPMGFYEQTINKYKINPLDSNFRPPSLGSDFLQLLQQQLQQQNQQQHQQQHQQHQQHQHEMQFNACPHGNQSQQQQQSASVYGYGNHHCVHQQQQPPHGSSACSCSYIMPQNPFPQQQQTQQETQFKDFDQTEI